MMRLLQITGTLDPQYGGPPVVLDQLTRALTALGHHVDVATLDAPSAAWLSGRTERVDAFGPGFGKYGYARRLRLWLRDNVFQYDAVVVHGIWQYQSVATRTACRAAGVPYFVFAHGALDPWFEKRYPAKHLKKAAYWRLLEHRVLRDARAVLFTREEERRLARESFSPYRVTELVVDVGVEDPGGDADAQRETFLAAFPALQGRRYVLFLGRLHPKKGGDLLIRAFADALSAGADLRLVMAGPDEGGTRADWEKLCDAAGLTDEVTWTGMIEGDLKWGAYRAADAFALTSHSENFGLVIPEALACGLPVLITDKVNIWREIDRAGAGLVEPDTQEGANALLQRWVRLTADEREAMRVNARRCFEREFEARRAAGAFIESIAEALKVERSL